MIHGLHNWGYADFRLWSRPLPTATPEEFISILLRSFWFNP
ncbi:MAG: hypothetical protein EDM05_033835 [Leptolyngbya sp. IPPAS B-1204]